MAILLLSAVGVQHSLVCLGVCLAGAMTVQAELSSVLTCDDRAQTMYKSRLY